MAMGTMLAANSALFRLAYRGDSMGGTFRGGDCLWIEPVAFAALRVGDVVAMEVEGKAVAHRLAGRAGDGFSTRGDAGRRPDPEVLHSDRLIGRVMVRERGGRRTPVAGGWAGRCRAGVLHGWWRGCAWGMFPLAPLYRRLRAGRWLARIWKPQVTVVRFTGVEGPFAKYIHRGRTVACWIPGEGRWTCRKPYDLVLGPPVR